MTINTIISVADYYGTKGARELAHRVKNNDVAAIATMARSMTAVAIEHLPANSVLIPMPSHTGHATNTLLLAEQISQITGFPVLGIVKGKERQPWYEMKLKGSTAKTITNDFFGFHLFGDTGALTPVIVDIVFDSGKTASAIAHLFTKQAIFLIYARVHNK